MTEDDATRFAADGDPSLDDGLDFAPLEEAGADETAALYEDLEEVEHDGKTFTIPRALKPALMMQADYTRKTQELAQQRRAWEAERAEQAKALSANLAERTRLAGVDEAAERQGREEALEAQRDHATRVQDGLEVLARDIDGWSPDLAGKLVEFGQAELGFTAEEMSQVMDPRLIKLLHRAWDGATRSEQHQRAGALAQAQKTSPAMTLRGSGGALRVAADTDDFAAFERLADAKLK